MAQLIGSRLIVHTGSGVRFTGSVKFATDSFISVDQGGGVTAILKLDPGANKWFMGKTPVTFTAVSFGERLRQVAELARTAKGALEL